MAMINGAEQGCRSLLSIGGGGEFAILPQFCPIFNIGGMNLDHDFDQVSKLSEDRKKRSSLKMEHFPNSGEVQKKGLHQKWNSFFPRIQVDTYAQMHTRVKLLGGDTVKLLGDISSHTPRVLAPLELSFLWFKAAKCKGIKGVTFFLLKGHQNGLNLLCSVARGGGGLQPPPPHWPNSMQNTTFLVLLRPIFAPKMNTAPPMGLASGSCEGLAVIWTRKVELFFVDLNWSWWKTDWILVKTFFFGNT